MTTPTTGSDSKQPSGRSAARAAMLFSGFALSYWVIGYVLVYASSAMSNLDTELSVGLIGMPILVSALVATPFVVIIVSVIGFRHLRSEDKTIRRHAISALLLQLAIIATALPVIIFVLNR